MTTSYIVECNFADRNTAEECMRAPLIEQTFSDIQSARELFDSIDLRELFEKHITTDLHTRLNKNNLMICKTLLLQNEEKITIDDYQTYPA